MSKKNTMEFKKGDSVIAKVGSRECEGVVIRRSPKWQEYEVEFPGGTLHQWSTSYWCTAPNVRAIGPDAIEEMFK